MKNLTYFLFHCCLFMSLQACQAQKPVAAVEAVESVTYQKGRGRCVRCPQYTLTIMSDGLAKYNGMNSMTVMGISEFNLAKSDLDEIQDLLNQIDIQVLDEKYQTNVRDKPMMTIIIDEKRVRFQEKVCPKELQALVAKLGSLVPY